MYLSTMNRLHTNKKKSNKQTTLPAKNVDTLGSEPRSPTIPTTLVSVTTTDANWSAGAHCIWSDCSLKKR